MNPELLKVLRDPITHLPLRLEQGILIGSKKYAVIDGIPRFVEIQNEAVQSFGDEWNHFNFIDFKKHWLHHIIQNTFGTLDSSEVFKGKIVVDAGAGSGSQSKWIAEAGASKVYALELSHSVDGVMKLNLNGLSNVEVIQCSIDNVPLVSELADIVYCVNVIQHTPSVENTAVELFRLVKPGGELVFTCYNENGWGKGIKRIVRKMVHNSMRAIISKLPFRVILFYSHVMSFLRFIPLLGWLLEGCLFMCRGEVLERGWKAKYKAGVLNTFDMFGSHTYQHIKTERELRDLVSSLNPTRALNVDKMFGDPPPIGCAFRITK